MGMSRMWARMSWRRRLALVALVVACGASLRAPATVASRAAFPGVPAASVAHLLADFSTHPHASVSRPGSWYVEEERGNYTEWHYRVSFACGARCAGSARVLASVADTRRHGRARSHRVLVNLEACSWLPLLPYWPRICDEMEVESVVSEAGVGAGAGCVVYEVARAWCGVARVALGACARELRVHRDTHFAGLRGALLTAA